jgi:hypothetical protein
MSKLRIIQEKIKFKDPIYKVQVKKWYGWRTEQDINITPGGGVSYYDMTFKTIEEAEHYIIYFYSKSTISVVKTFNL